MKLEFLIRSIPERFTEQFRLDKDNIPLLDVHYDLWFLWNKNDLKHEEGEFKNIKYTLKKIG